jgi:hypothetical protein
MTHLFRAALALCAVVVASVCGAQTPSGGPDPAHRWTSGSPAGEIAAWARQACGGARGGKRACMERTLIGLMDEAGVAKSMEVLDTLLRVDDEVRANGHELAHGVGIAAYRSPETLPATFAACPATQGAGCNHGVIQGYFLALQARGRLPGTAELDAVCEPHRPDRFLYFHCAHAVGHGLMAVHGNHVPRSLRGCDLATDGFVRESCYGGVFMENLVVVTQPHHTTAGHAAAGGTAAAGDAGGGHGAHGGHGADASAVAGGEWRALDRADPLYPCNVVEAKYQPSCYTMQTGAILHFNFRNVAATGRACERAPEAMVPICFGSLGRDVIALAGQDHRRSLELCARVAGQAGGSGGRWCMEGAVQNLVNLAADPAEGMRFCRLVTADGDKTACYRAVGEIVYSFAATDELRHASCLAAESPFIEACRLGAALPPAETQSGESSVSVRPGN